MKIAAANGDKRPPLQLKAQKLFAVYPRVKGTIAYYRRRRVLTKYIAAREKIARQELRWHKFIPALFFKGPPLIKKS